MSSRLLIFLVFDHARDIHTGKPINVGIIRFWIYNGIIYALPLPWRVRRYRILHILFYNFSRPDSWLVMTVGDCNFRYFVTVRRIGQCRLIHVSYSKAQIIA